LCNKILAAGATHDDKSISPVIRQTLLHWSLEITPEILAEHAKRTTLNAIYWNHSQRY
jgi:hypothetical protein